MAACDALAVGEVQGSEQKAGGEASLSGRISRAAERHEIQVGREWSKRTWDPAAVEERRPTGSVT